MSGVLPELYYRNADEAIVWLKRAFGFDIHYIVPEDDGKVHTAQLRLGDGYFMVRNERDTSLSPASANATTQQLMVVVDDVDAHFAHSKAEGVRVKSEPANRVYGERDYSALDLDDHVWTFTQHLADVDPIAMFGAPDR